MKKIPFSRSVESWHAYPYSTCRQVEISFFGMPQIAHFQVEKWKSSLAPWDTLPPLGRYAPSQRLCPPKCLAHYATVSRHIAFRVLAFFVRRSSFHPFNDFQETAAGVFFFKKKCPFPLEASIHGSPQNFLSLTLHISTSSFNLYQPSVFILSLSLSLSLQEYYDTLLQVVP